MNKDKFEKELNELEIEINKFKGTVEWSNYTVYLMAQMTIIERRRYVELVNDMTQNFRLSQVQAEFEAWKIVAEERSPSQDSSMDGKQVER